MRRGTKISGMISVTVDAVDLEQIEIEMPLVVRESISVKAILASQRNESFRDMQRSCGKNGYDLEYEGFEDCGNGLFEVTFRTSLRKRLSA